MKKIVCLFLVPVLLTGCATQNTVELARIAEKGYEKYLLQDKVADLIRVRAPAGQTIEFTIKGAEELVLNTQVPALSIMPQGNNALRDFMDGAARIATVAGAAAVGYKGVTALGDIATSPTVVMQPEPLVVNPVIVGAQ